MIIIIIIIILSYKSNSSKSYKVIGEINCQYDIRNSNEMISILGDDFHFNSKFDIYIDYIKIPLSKKYKFEKE